MKFKFLIALLFVSFQSVAQLSSYQDSKVKVQVAFDMAMKSSDKMHFIISAKENYEVQLLFGQESERIEEMKAKAMQASNCLNCKLILTTKVRKPLDYIFKNIEESDVFILYKIDDNYYNLEYYKSGVDN
jgi:uncharacterized GH25 family protein